MRLNVEEATTGDPNCIAPTANPDNENCKSNTYKPVWEFVCMSVCVRVGMGTEFLIKSSRAPQIFLPHTQCLDPAYPDCVGFQEGVGWGKCYTPACSYTVSQSTWDPVIEGEILKAFHRS